MYICISQTNLRGQTFNLYIRDYGLQLSTLELEIVDAVQQENFLSKVTIISYTTKHESDYYVFLHPHPLHENICLQTKKSVFS
jgi:hypothetical protein